MDFLDRLKWRYATKKFSIQKLKLSTLDKILEAANLSATSYGLQAFKILVIDDPEVRKQLLPHAMDQHQIVDASHLLVLCQYNDVTEADVEAYAKRIGAAKNKTEKQIVAYSNKIKDKIAQYTSEGTLDFWTAKQVYIVLGTLLAACASLEVDSCPMEGFSPGKFDEILNLKSMNLKSTVLLPIGFRAQDDAYQYKPKVRKDLEDLLVFI